ncbi:hypothetical protein AGABI2DRAFT_70538 [Agaricus bisporus var. bisporus H97]|uniref:hypothetical protein n=1 Tax=Agaricus bisporus var. bisporus (strain H97 / ATCC MYA-4626 / FGSC 10389) TaxID=936046 RepID=UPI00029F5DC4|nr:hypothetical protein AGABI2DRAFT_70538 [Agaricus bisporus var. bisporus H97]EKV46899.1 hypothetical protein AGABI2DRAFT_70538 [Agaricus bisporus var. bisporus H97]
MSTGYPVRGLPQDLAGEHERFRALQKHRAAMFILTQKDRPIPSFQEMEEDLRKDDLTSVKDRIATAKEDFKNDLERLYTAHAEEYLDDQRLRRESREDYKQSDGRGRWVEWFEKRDPVASTDQHYIYSVSSHVTTTIFNQTSHLASLYRQKATIEERLEEERRQKDAAFPLTLEEFRSKPRDIQIRVATFLDADAVKQDRMMTKFSWAWRQVEGLIREFKDNVSVHFAFRGIAELSALLYRKSLRRM